MDPISSTKGSAPTAATILLLCLVVGLVAFAAR